MFTCVDACTRRTMQLCEEFPAIYGVENNGKTKVWSARIYRDILNDNAMVEIEYGQLEGKKQVVSREYTEGKNIGKKNETSPLQQCIAETKRKWQDKMEKEAYSLVQPSAESKPNETVDPIEPIETIETIKVKVFPMLAHTYDPNSVKNKKNDIVFPCYVQPKLDGLRCIIYTMANGKVVAQSRTGSYFETVEHICAELQPILMKTPGLILDGELYTTDIPFEELAGLIKKKKMSEADLQRLQCIKYHIYDLVIDAPYCERYTRIVETIPKTEECFYLEVVPTQLIHDVIEFKQAFSDYVAGGYEGIMLRNVHGLYRQNYRSHDLQKYKEFVESEYPIVGFKEADGRDKGTVVWVCKTAEGREFSVRPKGSQEHRRECFQNGEQFIGKLLTVIYQELSELNVPRFPVGKAIRDGY